MTDRPYSEAPDDLERSLGRLADDLAFPPTPEFALDFSELTQERPAPLRLSATTWWKAGLAAAIVLLALTLAIPDARRAAADWLGFPGIRIEIGDRDDDVPATVTSIGGSLLLGEPAPLNAIQAQVSFPILLPGGALDGIAPESYFKEYNDTPVVSLLYPPSDDLPEIGTTGVGLLLMEIDASGDTSMFIVKRASAETPPLPVTVNGHDGMWIQGGVLMTDAGDPFWTYLRRSGNVLVWEQDGITYRMESDLPLSDAIALAESLEPAAP